MVGHLPDLLSCSQDTGDQPLVGGHLLVSKYVVLHGPVGSCLALLEPETQFNRRTELTRRSQVRTVDTRCMVENS